MKVLVAGGAGYIGSTIASAVIDAGHEVVVLDNLVTGRREFCADRTFYEGDIADGVLIDRIFTDHPDIFAVVHCAALIVVPESVAQPIRYYRENVAKTLDFVDHLLRNGATKLIFSSSASIYQPGADLTVDENSRLCPLSPYARTKMVVEGMLADIAAGSPLRVLSLRYFNPIGADPKMRTGLQLAAPTHALGMLIRAHRAGVPFTVTGTDYPTRDGSGIRDYVHVWDLADAHVRALQRFDGLFAESEPRDLVINLGTGTGTTVLEFVNAFNEVVTSPVEVQYGPPRPGDSVGAFTRSARAAELLGWTTKHSIAEGIRDTLSWFEVREQLLPHLAKADERER